jgi:DNA (cytosine-5)-methyltransferase 1
VTGTRRALPTVSLFAGIGGIDAGLERAGHETLLQVESFVPAAHVLRAQFPESKLDDDVRHLERLPKETRLVAAGFPCQDLSSVGPKVGIEGTKSSLVGEVMRLLALQPVPWLLLENVPFLLDLDRGKALRLITSALEELGYRWAYRVIDTEAFGLPQRRRRWFLVATLDGDPRAVLLADEKPRPSGKPHWEDVGCGFYWTEGTRALGWAVDAVPPIKCGSSVGVASPPAIIIPSGEVVTPDIRDAERLQGFPADWTKPAEDVIRASHRWRLVGNAVTINVAQWIGERLLAPGTYDPALDPPIAAGERWPKAAWSMGDGAHRSRASDTPLWAARPGLLDFLQFPAKPLSGRAASGFLRRASKASLRFAPGFLDRVRAHAIRQGSDEGALPLPPFGPGPSHIRRGMSDAMAYLHDHPGMFRADKLPHAFVVAWGANASPNLNAAIAVGDLSDVGVLGSLA